MMGSGSSNLRACRFQFFDGKLQKTFVDESGIERILNNVKPAHTLCNLYGRRRFHRIRSVKKLPYLQRRTTHNSVDAFSIRERSFMRALFFSAHDRCGVLHASFPAFVCGAVEAIDYLR